MKKTLFASACCAVLAFGLAAYGDTFCFQKVGPKPIDSGYDVALAILASGQPAICWIRHNGESRELWYAEFDGGAWAKTLVRAVAVPEDMWASHFAILASGEPAFSYGYQYYQGSTPHSGVWYTQEAQGVWNHERVTGADWMGPFQTTRVVILENGSPGIAFTSQTDFDYRTFTVYAHRDAGGTWSLAQLDWGSEGRDSWPDAVALPSGEAGVVYCRISSDLQPCSLVAFSEGPAFARQLVDWDDWPYETGEACSLALLPSGRPALTYEKEVLQGGLVRSLLRYAEFDGAAWQIESDFGSPEGLWVNSTCPTRLVTLQNGEPMIAWHTGEQLAFTWRDRDRWETITWPDYPIGQFDIQPLPNGDLAVVYSGPTPPPWGNFGFVYLVGHRIPNATLRGDLNCDGAVDFEDINPFVQYLSSVAAWQATYPDCPPENGDINCDGTYGQGSFGDINPFVQCVILGYCP